MLCGWRPALLNDGESKDRCAFVHPCLIPESKFDTVAQSNLVVDLSQVVPDNVLPDAQLFRDFTVLESLRNQLYDSKLPSAGFPGSVSFSHAFRDGQPARPPVFISLKVLRNVSYLQPAHLGSRRASSRRTRLGLVGQ